MKDKLLTIIAKMDFKIDDIEDICHVYFFKKNLQQILKNRSITITAPPPIPETLGHGVSTSLL